MSRVELLAGAAEGAKAQCCLQGSCLHLCARLCVLLLTLVAIVSRLPIFNDGGAALHAAG